jgi:hypothetical protein
MHSAGGGFDQGRFFVCQIDDLIHLLARATSYRVSLSYKMERNVLHGNVVREASRHGHAQTFEILAKQRLPSAAVEAIFTLRIIERQQRRIQ